MGVCVCVSVSVCLCVCVSVCLCVCVPLWCSILRDFTPCWVGLLMLTIYRSQFNTHMTILIFILAFFPFQSPLLWDFMFISFPSPNNMFEFGEYSCLIE